MREVAIDLTYARHFIEPGPAAPREGKERDCTAARGAHYAGTGVREGERESFFARRGRCLAGENRDGEEEAWLFIDRASERRPRMSY